MCEVGGLCVCVCVCWSRWWSLAGCVQGSKSSPLSASRLIPRNRKDRRTRRCDWLSIWLPRQPPHPSCLPVSPPFLPSFSPLPSPSGSTARLTDESRSDRWDGSWIFMWWDFIPLAAGPSPSPTPRCVCPSRWEAASSLLSLRLICLLCSLCARMCVCACVCVCMSVCIWLVSRFPPVSDEKADLSQGALLRSRAPNTFHTSLFLSRSLSLSVGGEGGCRSDGSHLFWWLSMSEIPKYGRYES